MKGKQLDNKSFSLHNTKTKQTAFNACNTGVNPIRTHGLGIFNGRRVVWSVRVDETLLKQVKPILKAKFGSTCRGVETWLAALTAAHTAEVNSGVYPSNTVEIGTLRIERNLRSRRKLDAVERENVTVKCACCENTATGDYRYLQDDVVYGLCGGCGQDMTARGTWVKMK